MIEKVRTEDAIGKPLIHDITSIRKDGFKGVLFKRNHIIQSDDIDKLKDIGKEHIYVGELEDNQVHEEDAILEIAPKIVDDNIEWGLPSEGKITFKSKVRGLFKVNEEAAFKLNSIEDYTFASISNNTVVDIGDKLIGGRIVPLYTTRDLVEEAKKISEENNPIYRVLKFYKKRVGIIITGSEIYSGRIKDMFEPMIREKLKFYGGEIVDVIFVPDDIDKLLESMRELLSKDIELLILSGGMSVDPDDLTPTAIRNISSDIIFKGVPIQPGNMLTVGVLKKTYIVGVPGASIHSSKTSLDLLLPKIFSNSPVNKDEFIKMSVGGLL
ncbi:molybdopterin-binding protein [Peptoniphilus mikwangii]|uniref:molybdopterin-binding protein n=1 Tax=Peptoniphilus mikwangii TaxID=1354300 RepID=UPI00040D0DB1|nr:molybdopterin-binding protein [Peptoniphilus mikwangii]